MNFKITKRGPHEISDVRCYRVFAVGSGGVANRGGKFEESDCRGGSASAGSDYGGTVRVLVVQCGFIESAEAALREVKWKINRNYLMSF
jgi:hypothetical protein